jgi:glutathione S-transferase
MAQGQDRAGVRIWGRANSSNVMKLLVLCDEIGVPVERIDAGGAFGRTKHPAYLAMNPNALVPVLEEPDGFTLYESNAIMRYLARTRAPGHAIYPAAPRAAADCDKWLDWQLGTLNRPMTVIFFTHIRTPEADRDWPATHKARDEAERLWAQVEARLAGRPWLVGDAMTLADIAIGIFAHRWFALPISRAEMPRLATWYAALCARPAFAAHAIAPLT